MSTRPAILSWGLGSLFFVPRGWISFFDPERTIGALVCPPARRCPLSFHTDNTFGVCSCVRVAHGQVRQGKAMHDTARQCNARHCKARHCKARQGKARQCNARQDKARHGKPRQGKAPQKHNMQKVADPDGPPEEIPMPHADIPATTSPAGNRTTPAGGERVLSARSAICLRGLGSQAAADTQV